MANRIASDHTYYYNSFMPHADLPVEKQSCDRWVKLFFQTLEEHFKDKKQVKPNGILLNDRNVSI